MTVPRCRAKLLRPHRFPKPAFPHRNFDRERSCACENRVLALAKKRRIRGRLSHGGISDGTQGWRLGHTDF